MSIDTPTPSSTVAFQQTLALSPSVPVHFVGIGGIGMSGLAKLLLANGFQVSGSDVKDSAVIRALVASGATISTQGHQAENLPTGAQVIVSTAIQPNNPEIEKALLEHLPIVHRSTLLREILQGALLGHAATLGISGTHGKTTITGMTGLALQAAGAAPTIVAGGVIPSLGTNAVWGEGRRVAVAELDESDGTILQYTPTLTVVANLELDHADHYPQGLSGITDTFAQYLQRLQPGSRVLFNAACANTRALAMAAPAHIVPICISDDAEPFEAETLYGLTDVRACAQGYYQGVVSRNGTALGTLRLSVPGRHNLFNALNAVALGDQLGLPFGPMAEALAAFTGMGRRFEKLGTLNGAQMVDDYAHHPTEVAATLKAAKESLSGGGRVMAIFQPHRYSRLQALWDGFVECFGDAETLYLTDVYGAGEAPIPGISAEALAAAVQRRNPGQKVIYLPRSEWPALRATLSDLLQPGDCLLSLGAGDVTQLLRDLP